MHKIKPKNSWEKNKIPFIIWKVHFLVQMGDSKRGVGIICPDNFFSNLFSPIFFFKVMEIISLDHGNTFLAINK